MTIEMLWLVFLAVYAVIVALVAILVRRDRPASKSDDDDDWINRTW
jgi:hypothetical protein